MVEWLIHEYCERAEKILIKQAQGLLLCAWFVEHVSQLCMKKTTNFDDLSMLLDLSLFDHYYLARFP